MVARSLKNMQMHFLQWCSSRVLANAAPSFEIVDAYLLALDVVRAVWNSSGGRRPCGRRTARRFISARGPDSRGSRNRAAFVSLGTLERQIILLEFARKRSTNDCTLVSIAYTKALTERPGCNRPKGEVWCSSLLD